MTLALQTIRDAFHNPAVMGEAGCLVIVLGLAVFS